jgi:hypothetical protein
MLYVHIGKSMAAQPPRHVVMIPSSSLFVSGLHRLSPLADEKLTGPLESDKRLQLSSEL